MPCLLLSEHLVVTVLEVSPPKEKRLLVNLSEHQAGLGLSLKQPLLLPRGLLDCRQSLPVGLLFEDESFRCNCYETLAQSRYEKHVKVLSPDVGYG